MGVRIRSLRRLGEIEEYLPIVCDVVLKESAEFPKAITDQVSDAIYTIERLINGTPDLDVEGVYRTRVQEVHTSAGRMSALQGTPFEIVRNHIVVTHIYPDQIRPCKWMVIFRITGGLQKLLSIRMTQLVWIVRPLYTWLLV